MSLLESVLLGITAVIFLIMLFKKCRVLYFFILSAVVSIILFTIRIIENGDSESAFFDSFGLPEIFILVFLLIVLFKAWNSKKNKN